MTRGGYLSLIVLLAFGAVLVAVGVGTLLHHALSGMP